MYPQVFGKYVLERELARGGMARVVLATLRGAGGFEKRMVVKQIRDELACDDEFVRRFVEEAKTAVSLAHPNIVPVYELGVEMGTYFLAMEFVEGVSLAELLRAGDGQGDARPRLSPEEGAYVGVEVCRALDYAHRRMNVVHRDVTPRNVMVDEEGQVKVIDFGIAAPVATAPDGHGVFGSPGHMPPEQGVGGQLTPAADVFAVAVLLGELWSGRAPFRRRTPEEIEAAMRAPPPKVSEADIRLLPLDDVIAAAMALDPKERPQQADDLGRALRRFLAGVDLGDVARQLGDRVRRARTHPAPPAARATAALQRPASRPTATQVGTRTFAARAEVRALDSSAAARFTDGAAPAAAPEPEGSTRKLASIEPPSRASEATPVPPPAASRPSSRMPARVRRFVWVGPVGAGVLSVAAFFLGRGAASPPTRAPPPVPVAHEGTTLAAVAPSTAPAPDAPVPAPAGARPRAADQGEPAAAASAVQTEPSAERAQLALLGDGTVARLDGVARGACPLRLPVEPGAHVVVFTFPATGESRSERVVLRAGERATLRADFTGAAPTIRVERRPPP
jgi:eukaryotic-like serine/threonine-protein kinase